MSHFWDKLRFLPMKIKKIPQSEMEANKEPQT
jgi:hypothetical protein